MRVVGAITLVPIVSFATLAAATQVVAMIVAYQPALGAPAFKRRDGALYWPWSILTWAEQWRDAYPRPFAVADFIILCGLSAGVLVMMVVSGYAPPRLRRHGPSGWANFEDVREAHLFASTGAVLGKFDNEMLAYNGAGHLLLIGASRSGKGRGHVVPTLLAWPKSALVLDVKGELASGDPRHSFPGTEGFRETLGPVLRFSPTRPGSARFNPFFEVRKGSDEVRDVQN